MAANNRYDQDYTGVNPNNRVVGEIARLSVKKRRAAVPMYAPFFKESFKIWDITKPDPLIEGVDFEFVDIGDELTRQVGKEIYYAVLIINESVSDTVRFDYQCVGGLHTFSSSGLKELYENAMRNDAPVDWTTGVINKPSVFPPSLHSHYLADWRGFEPIISQLERLRNAITLSNLPAFERIFDWVKSRGLTIEDIVNGTTEGKYLTYETFTFLSQNLNFNVFTVDPKDPTAFPGASIRTTIEASNMPDGTKLFWTLEYDGMLASDFYRTSGEMTMMDKVATFTVSPKSSVAYPGVVRFRYVIRSLSESGPVVYTSKWITITESKYRSSMHAAFQACCVLSPKIPRSAKSYAIAGLSEQHH